MARRRATPLVFFAFGAAIAMACGTTLDLPPPADEHLEGGASGTPGDAALPGDAGDGSSTEASAPGRRCTVSAVRGSPCEHAPAACTPAVINDAGTAPNAYAFGLAVDDTHLYWAEQSDSNAVTSYNGGAPGRIIRMPKRGGEKEAVVTQLDAPALTFVEAGQVFFTAFDSGRTRRLLFRVPVSCREVCAPEGVFAGAGDLGIYPVNAHDFFYWDDRRAYARRVDMPEAWVEGPRWPTLIFFSAAVGGRDFFATWQDADHIDRLSLDAGIDAAPTPFLATPDGGPLGVGILTADCDEVFTTGGGKVEAHPLDGGTRLLGTVTVDWHQATQDELFVYGATWNAGRLSRLRKSGSAEEQTLIEGLNAWFVAVDDEAVYVENHTGSTVISRVPK